MFMVELLISVSGQRCLKRQIKIKTLEVPSVNVSYKAATCITHELQVVI